MQLKSYSRAVTGQHMGLKGKYPRLCSTERSQEPRRVKPKGPLTAKEQSGPRTAKQMSAVLPAAYYQPSLTAEYDEDSPGGDFDFFANLVTKWEAAAKLPGDSTRQVVVRSGENQGTVYQAGLECLLSSGRMG